MELRHGNGRNSEGESIFQQGQMQRDTRMVSTNSNLTVFLPMAALMVFQEG